MKNISHISQFWDLILLLGLEILYKNVGRTICHFLTSFPITYLLYHLCIQELYLCPLVKDLLQILLLQIKSSCNKQQSRICEGAFQFTLSWYIHKDIKILYLVICRLKENKIHLHEYRISRNRYIYAIKKSVILYVPFDLPR